MRECGLVHSSFDTVPLIVTGLLTSYSPATEWCARSGTAAHRSPATTIASRSLIAAARSAGSARDQAYVRRAGSTEHRCRAKADPPADETPGSAAASGAEPGLLPSERFRCREPRGVDGHVGLDLVERDRVLPVRPRDDDLVRHLHAGDVAIVGEVDLRRHGADRRPVPAHVAHQEPGFVA